MRLYFLSDEGLAAVSCDKGTGPELKAVMAACGYWQASLEQYKERAQQVRGKERTDARRQEREDTDTNRRYHAE